MSSERVGGLVGVGVGFGYVRVSGEWVGGWEGMGLSLIFFVLSYLCFYYKKKVKLCLNFRIIRNFMIRQKYVDVCVFFSYFFLGMYNNFQGTHDNTPTSS